MNGISLNKEVAIRKRILRIYNKTRDDFEALRDYNDYLEEVEDVIFNLVEGQDVTATEARVQQYREQNQDQIAQAHARQADVTAGALRDQQETHNPPPPAGPQAAPYGSIPPGGMPAIPRLQPTPMAGGMLPHHDGELSPGQRELAARAAGWTDAIGRKRAIEEAFGTLGL